MAHDLIYTFPSFEDARSAIKRIEAHYDDDTVTGLSFVSDATQHLVAVSIADATAVEELQRLLIEHNGVITSLTLDAFLCLPATIKVLGNAGPLIDLIAPGG